MDPSSPYLSSSSVDAILLSRGRRPVLWNQHPNIYRYRPRRADRRGCHIVYGNPCQQSQPCQQIEDPIVCSSDEHDNNFDYEYPPFNETDKMPMQMRVPLKTIGVRGFALQDSFELDDNSYPKEHMRIAQTLSSHHFKLQDICEAYTVAYNSPERASQMTDRFAKIGLKLNVHTGVQMDDDRLAFADNDIPAKRLASVFYGHLDNIAKFYETGKPYGLFCEDDVYLHKDLGKELPIMMGEFNAMQLDILLLGYMTTKTIEWWQHGYSLVYDGGAAPYRYHRYPQDQWGIHLFMISRSYAKKLMNAFGPDYAAKAYKDPSMTCCNPDWTLSKHTANRALRYPMMAVEDGKGNYSHHGQGEFHRESHRKNYVEGDFL